MTLLYDLDLFNGGGYANRAGEEARKSQLLIQADLEIKSTMDPIKELPVDRPIKKSKKSKKKNKGKTLMKYHFLKCPNFLSRTLKSFFKNQQINF